MKTYNRGIKDFRMRFEMVSGARFRIDQIYDEVGNAAELLFQDLNGNGKGIDLDEVDCADMATFFRLLADLFQQGAEGKDVPDDTEVDLNKFRK